MDAFKEYDFSGIIEVIDFLKPTTVYEGIGDIATVFLYFGVPIFFTFAFCARWLEESAKSMAGEAKFVVALKDTIVPCLFIAGYATMGVVLVKLISVIGAKFFEYGSFTVICDSYADAIESVKKLTAEKFGGESKSFWSLVRDGVGSVTTVIGYSFFYITIVLFVFIYAFLRLAYCLLYCLSYLWGFVAIPLTISKKIDLSSGWYRTLLCLLIWPIIEATFYGLSKPLFVKFSENIIDTYSGTAGATVLMANVFLLFGVTNLVLTALSVAAVFVAFFLSMNQSAALGIAAPFIAAAAAGAGIIGNMAHKVQKASVTNMARSGIKGASRGVGAFTRGAAQGAGAAGSFVSRAAGSVAGAANAFSDRLRTFGGGGDATDVTSSFRPPLKGHTAPGGGASHGSSRNSKAGSHPVASAGGSTSSSASVRPNASSRRSILNDIQKIGAASQGSGDVDPVED